MVYNATIALITLIPDGPIFCLDISQRLSGKRADKQGNQCRRNKQANLETGHNKLHFLCCVDGFKGWDQVLLGSRNALISLA
jgi:hypothetical protein